MIAVKQRYFEDYRVGESFELGSYAITESEIIEFATRYDPQPFHIDKRAAAESHFGGLVASGWMTAGALMKMLVDEFISPLSSMGSPGVDELRWLVPVRPGDRLRARVTILAARRSESKPDRGSLHVLQEAINQNDEVVLSMRGWGIYKLRAP